MGHKQYCGEDIVTGRAGIRTREIRLCAELSAAPKTGRRSDDSNVKQIESRARRY